MTSRKHCVFRSTAYTGSLRQEGFRGPMRNGYGRDNRGRGVRQRFGRSCDLQGRDKNRIGGFLMATLALIHTIHPIIPQIEEICRRRLPGVRTAHFLDETILRDLIARGRMDAEIVRRVTGLVVRAERGGARRRNRRRRSDTVHDPSAHSESPARRSAAPKKEYPDCDGALRRSVSRGRLRPPRAA